MHMYIDLHSRHTHVDVYVRVCATNGDPAKRLGACLVHEQRAGLPLRADSAAAHAEP